MAKALLGAALGAVAMFVWGFVSWTVLQFHTVNSFDNSTTVAESMRSSGAESGVYFIPAMPGTTDQESAEFKKFKEQHERGPVAFVVYSAEGKKAMDPLSMAKGFAVMFASTLVVVFLLMNAKIANYLGRVLFVVSFGLFAAVFSEGSNWAWFHFPMQWTIQMALDHLIAWGLAGVVIAALVKPASR